MAKGEGYSANPLNEPVPFEASTLPNFWVAISPLVVVFILNRTFTTLLPRFYGITHSFQLEGMKAPVVTQVPMMVGIWAVEIAIFAGILTVFALAWKPVTKAFMEGSKAAVGGAMLAAWPVIGTATAAVLAGTLAGERVLHRIPDLVFKRVVAGIIGAIGILLLCRFS